tara:strand:- start:384 stop:1358 length:975 start_codon:yes stop_codon:yes gene_type:complete
MFIKQSTAYTFRFGPFVDDTDGKTAETGLTIEDSHVRVSKAGGNFVDKNESSNSAHDEAGFYVVVLDTTDTATVGELQIAAHISGALPVFKTFQVVEEAIYDALFAASADLITKVDAIDTVVDAILVDTGTTLDGKLNTIDDFLDTEVAAILADTNELQTDWANGGRLDALIDSIIAGVNVTTIEGVDATDAIQTSSSASLIAYNLDHLMKTAVASNADMTTEVTDGSVLSNIMTKTGDTSDYAYATDSLEGLAGVWTTALTESYASDGAAATPAQLLYMIYCTVGEFSISGTTITGKKVDGSTTAMTWTINSASDPTSRTRAS